MMHHTRWRASIASLFFFVFVGVACGKTYAPFVPDDPYPTQSEVEALEAEPVPQVTIEQSGLVVERWGLSGPFPEMIGAQPHNPVGPVQEIASGFTGGSMITSQMTCVARELALFVAEKDAYPADYIVDFIMDRCGSISLRRRPFARWRTWEPHDDGVPRAEEVLAREDFDELVEISKSVGGSRQHGELGAWFTSLPDGRAIALFVAGKRTVEIDPIPRVPSSKGVVRVSGQVLGPAHYVWGAITQGRTDWAPCSVDPRVSVPRFVIECPTRADDPVVRFDLAVTRRRTSPTSQSIFSQRVWPAGTIEDVFESSAHRQFASTIKTEGQVGSSRFPEEFVGMVNALRAQYDLPPLLHSEAQTRTVQRLTARFYEASEDAEKERILNSMLAGWGIANGEIVGSTFASRTVPVDDPRALLAMLANDPYGRKLLFMKEQGVLLALKDEKGDVGKEAAKAYFASK